MTLYSYLLALALAAVVPPAAGPAGAQVTLAPDPARTRGAAAAPITIVEFSDYQ